MRFLADESCDFRVVRALREAGHDVMVVVDVAPGAEDDAVIALHLTGLLPELVRWLSDVEISFGRHALSLWTLLTAAFWVAMTLLLALWAGAALEARLMAAEGLHSSLRVV